MTPQENIKETAKLSQQYVSEEIEYIKLKLFYQVTSISSHVVKSSILGLFALLSMTFLSFAVAFWLGNLLDSRFLGFLSVGVFYLLITAIFYFTRKKIEKYVITKMAAKYF
ncbi:MAG: phage holin family protein [Flavobacteriaceae bacterium]